MGCPTLVIIGKNIVFSFYTHDPDTGAVTAASSAPSYWIRDEDDAAVLNGTMDSGNRTGSYRKKIAVTTANGFAHAKTYTIYVEATVDGDKGGITYEFTAYGGQGSALEDVAITAPATPDLCTVQFRVNLSSTAVSGAVCKAKLLGINQAADGIILSNEEVSDTTDSEGIAELQLVRKASIVKGSGIYKIWIEIDGKPVASIETTIPNQSTVLFEDLLRS